MSKIIINSNDKKNDHKGMLSDRIEESESVEQKNFLKSYKIFLNVDIGKDEVLY